MQKAPNQHHQQEVLFRDIAPNIENLDVPLNSIEMVKPLNLLLVKSLYEVINGNDDDGGDDGDNSANRKD